jgi:hypothetical protein
MYRRLSSLRRSANSVTNHDVRRLDSLRYIQLRTPPKIRDPVRIGESRKQPGASSPYTGRLGC